MAEFVEIMKIKKRMCKHYHRCDDCPLGDVGAVNCDSWLSQNPEQAEETILKWAEEHPKKTRLTDFLEKYPNAKLSENGIPISCADYLGYKCDNCKKTPCKDCWNTPLED